MLTFRATLVKKTQAYRELFTQTPVVNQTEIDKRRERVVNNDLASRSFVFWTLKQSIN